MSQINLQHARNNNSGEQEDYKVKTDMLRSRLIGRPNSPGNPWSQSGRRKGRKRKGVHGGKDLQKREVLNLE